ncbi:MAG: nucleotide exchange factor GrpE [Paludibacteraceae bacterium]
MSKKNKRKMEENTEKKAPEMEQEVKNEVMPEAETASAETAAEESAAPAAEETAEQEAPQADLHQEVETLTARVAELEDKNLRMMAEFDNYRRRTNKEKLALMETAGEKIFTEMLALVDDFERAQAAMQKTEDIESLRSGIELIHQKFISFLDKHDVHAIETENADFNTDEHEAVTTFAAGEDKKGKVIDCTQKGYKLGEKVIRFAKVVVGE